MAHPHLGAGVDTFHERVAAVDIRQARAAILTGGRGLNTASGLESYELGAIADSEHRKTEGAESGKVGPKCLFVIDREGRSREDDAYHRLVAKRILVVGDYLAVDVKLTDAASDELSGLRAKVEYYYFFLHEICGMDWIGCIKMII